jgi:hypothetical protein
MHDKEKRMAAYLSGRLPGWVVISAPYHRGFTAFGACTPDKTIIDEPDPAKLLDRMRAAQLAALHGLRTGP